MNHQLQKNEVFSWPQSFSCSAVPVLKSNEIHIWQALLPDYEDKNTFEHFWSVLHKDEQDRAEKFFQKKHRKSFVVARAILRFLLAQYLNCAPQQIFFNQNKYGKLLLAQNQGQGYGAVGVQCEQCDVLANREKNIYFNISHAADIVMYSFVLDKQIGIDVEYMRDDRSLAEIAERFFAPQEQQDFLAIKSEQQCEVFFNCWTRKEAFIKAIGRGLSYSLKNFNVDISSKKSQNQEITKVAFTIADNELSPRTWSLFNINTLPQYCAAMAVEGDCAEEQIRFMQCAHSLSFVSSASVS